MSQPQPPRVQLGPFQVDPCCLGTMTFGNKQCDEAAAFAILDAYVARGGNFIDTAEAYPVPVSASLAGETERILGKWLGKKTPQQRGELVIATKLAGPSGRTFLLDSREATLKAPVPSPEPELTHGEAQMVRAVDASLVRLQTTYIDLYQLHWPSRPVPLWGASEYTLAMSQGLHPMRDHKKFPASQGQPFEEMVRGLGKLLASGKIKAWGLSNETAFGVTMFCETCKRLGVALPVSIQNDFSVLDRRFEVETLEACAQYGVQLLPYGPLCGGMLTGKYLGAPANAKWRHVEFKDFQARYHAKPSREAAARYQALARAHNLTATELCLAWCASRWYVASTIIGCTSVAHLHEDYDGVLKAKALSDQVLAQVDVLHMKNKNPNVYVGDTIDLGE
jgi:aryl-alcohol dehydrogenase-like predicted oxidoreductase